MILLDPETETHSFGINILSCNDITSLKQRTDTYSRAYGIFHKLWEDEWGPWLQLIIQNTLYAFVENQAYTLSEVPLFLSNSAFRNHLVSNMRYNKEVRDFWQYEFGEKRDRDQQDQVQSALTRVRTLLNHQYVRDIVGQKTTTVDFGKVMAEQGLVLVKLSTSLAPDIKRFIGIILISELLQAARNRPPDARHQFCIFVDEFQNFASSEDFVTLITESRKFGIATTIAHQERYGQFEDNRKILGATSAAANKIFFQMTVKDAQELAPEFAEKAEATEIRREPELVISPRAVEDIWEKGTSNEYITYPREKYFWIVDLLKRYPTQAYFLHDQKKLQPKFQGEYMNLAKITPHEFDDWDLYRSSSDMLKQGVRLLNEYFYMAMRDGYRKHKITDDEVGVILKMIELWGGVLGFLPAMEPYIPDDMRIVFAQRITDSLTREREKLIAEAKRTYRYGEGIGIWGKMQDASMLKCLEQNNPKLYKTWTKLDIDAYPSLQNLEAWKKFAIFIGVGYHELDQIFQWTTKPFINSKQFKALEDLVIFVFSMPGDKTYHQELIRQYTVPFMIDEKVRWEALHPDISDDKYMDACINRLAWQTTEIVERQPFCPVATTKLAGMVAAAIDDGGGQWSPC